MGFEPFCLTFPFPLFSFCPFPAFTILTMPRQTYDDLAPHYDKAMRPFDRWFLARLRASTLRYLPAGASVLELGAGTGLNFAFYPADAEGVATEPSSAMLREAREKRRPADVNLIQSVAEHLPFKIILSMLRLRLWSSARSGVPRKPSPNCAA
jgi:SAM-dependent methyltransferase